MTANKKLTKIGPPIGSKNHLVHGGYQNLSLGKLDGRTKEARAVRHIQAELSTALGDVSPQQILLIQRASVKAVRCALAEAEILKANGDAAQSLQDDYLRWARELRADLLALGLERRSRNVMELKDYVRENYGTTD